jgi:hypothetical protein
MVAAHDAHGFLILIEIGAKDWWCLDHLGGDSNTSGTIKLLKQ